MTLVCWSKSSSFNDLFVLFPFMCKWVYLYVSVSSWTQVPMGGRCIRSVGPGFTYGCELPDKGSGSKSLIAGKEASILNCWAVL